MNMAPALHQLGFYGTVAWGKLFEQPAVDSN